MIRRLSPEDAERYIALRRASLVDTPLAFASSPETDYSNDLEAVRQSILFGAFDGEELVGAAGIFRERHRKAMHKAHVVGMYVAPSHRRRGLGGQLLDAVIAYARTLEGVTWLHLAVSSAAPDAQRLYECAGFEPWGIEPEGLIHEGASASLTHMAMRLDRNLQP